MKDQQNKIEPRNKSIFKCLQIFDKSVKLIQWERYSTQMMLEHLEDFENKTKHPQLSHSHIYRNVTQKSES